MNLKIEKNKFYRTRKGEVYKIVDIKNTSMFKQITGRCVYSKENEIDYIMYWNINGRYFINNDPSFNDLVKEIKENEYPEYFI